MSFIYICFSLLWSFVVIAGITHSGVAGLIAFAVMMLLGVVKRIRSRRKGLNSKPEPSKPHQKLIWQIRNDASSIKDDEAKKLLKSICNKAQKVINQGNFDEANYQLDLQNLAGITANMRSMRKQSQRAFFAENKAKLLQFKEKINYDLGRRDRALAAETLPLIDFLSATPTTEEFPEIEPSPKKPPENFLDTVNLLKRASESQKD